MRRYKIIVLLILCSLIFAGCWDQKLFEQTGLILISGIEDAGNGKIGVSFTYPVIGGKEKDSEDFVTEEVTLLRDARKLSRLSSPKFIEAGKVQEILISEDLAKKGIHDLLEVYQRDPTTPAVAYIVVVEGSPKELMEKGLNFEDKPRLGIYIYQLLENNSKSSTIPNTKVFDFDINFFAPGLDPITPIIKLGTNDVEIVGSALFRDDKMVGKLNVKETIMLLGMMGQIKNTDFSFSDPELKSDSPLKYGISAILKNPRHKINISFDNEGRPIVNIYIHFQCVLDEYKWNKTDDAKEQARLEKILSSHAENVCKEIVAILKETNSDPIGIGNLIRAKYNDYWKSVEWREIYKEVTIIPEVKMEIVKQGIIK